MAMARVGLLVRLEAKPGKEGDVETFLIEALDLVNQEPDTTSWYALRFGPSSFGIFDTFPDGDGRQDHLGGPIAAALGARAAELFASPPQIEMVDILAVKVASRRPGNV